MYEKANQRVLVEHIPHLQMPSLDPNDRQSAEQCKSGVLLVVEGPHDIEFLRRISHILHLDDATIPSLSILEEEGRLIFVPCGGGCLHHWSHRLGALAWREFHLYDREVPPETKLRKQAAKVVNARVGCRAVISGKRSLENYLHPAAIEEANGIRIAFSDYDSVPDVAARACLPSHCKWGDLSSRTQKRLRNRTKKWLNTCAVDRMTTRHLDEQDPQGELMGWLRAIARLAT